MGSEGFRKSTFDATPPNPALSFTRPSQSRRSPPLSMFSLEYCFRCLSLLLIAANIFLCWFFAYDPPCRPKASPRNQYSRDHVTWLAPQPKALEGESGWQHPHHASTSGGTGTWGLQYRNSEPCNPGHVKLFVTAVYICTGR